MRTVIYMAATINGYIAKDDDTTDWVSSEDWKGFETYCRQFGNVILGRRSINDAITEGYFPFFTALNVVMTHQKMENIWGDKVLFTDKSPKEVIQMLRKRGFENILIGGGGQINTLFLKEGLVDELYIDLEPIVFGRGIKLFADDTFIYKLQLLGTKKLNKHTLQLHYKVIK